MKALVTGGAGFIGSHLVEALVKSGCPVRVLDNFSSGTMENLRAVKNRVQIIRGDITRLETVLKCTNGVDAIFHEAALVSVPRSIQDPKTTHEVNVSGTLNVFEAARIQRVKRVIFASSCAVYGDSPALPKKETLPPNSVSFYAESKAICENYARLYHRYHTMDIVGLRYFNVFGERQDPNSPYSGVISIFIKKFNKNEMPVIYGDGKQTRDFIYVGDVVRANILAARQKGISGQVFNVGTGKETSLNGLLKNLNRVFGRKVRARYENARAGDVRRSFADTAKAARILKFKASHDFFEVLKKISKPHA